MNTKMKIEPVSKNVWQIPQTEKKGMNAPARIYATPNLLGAMDEGVFDQVTNMACLPGIVKYSIACPDAHWGYGFCVGGVAAFDAKDGVISPGGIGFDINCVAAGTKILGAFGYFKKIEEFENAKNENLISVELATNKIKHASPILFLEKPVSEILKITTGCGEELLLTQDHPLFDGTEMRKAAKFKEGDKIAIHPFDGVAYEKASEKCIIGEQDIVRVVGLRKKLLNELRKNGLLPLTENSEKLPILAKLAGFLTGDGWIGHHYNRKRKQDIWSARVIGKYEDLMDVAVDFKKLGYVTNYIKTKKYESSVESASGKKRSISGHSTQLYLNSQSLSVLLHALGVPKGNKSKTPTKVPQWIKESPKWIKRLYLAGLFGAELTKPAQRKGETHRFLEPCFSQNKITSLANENLNFMLDIIKLLHGFGVEVNNIYEQEGIINSHGQKTKKLAIRLSGKDENLIKLWGTIGFEYCKQRKIASMAALGYLKSKKHHIGKIDGFLKQAQSLILTKSTTKREVVNSATELGISKSMVSARLSQKPMATRAGSGFPTFAEFCKSANAGNSEIIIDKIEKIEKIPYNDSVYDLTMNDDDHNFIANCIVSHNCGMRIISTNLGYDEVRPKIKQLVDNLFVKVPAGVGVKGTISLKRNQVLDVMQTGANWCVENGYAWQEDIEHIEEHGKIAGADPENVSEKAIGRSMNQLGTLGSGNHYLEVQVIRAENIYDRKIASGFGVHDDKQVMIMVHCGSRGTGHQIATDYLKEFGPIMEKYKLEVKDRELACAPFNSEEGQKYYSAMACAANNAFANRQVITHNVREVFSQVFRKTPEEMEMNLIYDVAHNIAKVEKHIVDGKSKKLVVHRKGSTRSFGPGHEELASVFKKTGQPVIVGGSMETGSYVCVGTQKAMLETFGSTMHGSGRTMSRTRAKGLVKGEELQKEMEKKGIYVKTATYAGLAEEAGIAYKDISEVVRTMDEIGISKRVFSLKPVGNVKG